MTQGSRTNQVVDLDEDLIGKRLSRPLAVKLAGKQWSVRRDLTAEEIYAFWGHVSANNGAGAFAILMGIPEDEAKALDASLQSLPATMYVKKIHQLVTLAGLKRGNEPEDTTGESTPSSSGS